MEKRKEKGRESRRREKQREVGVLYDGALGVGDRIVRVWIGTVDISKSVLKLRRKPQC
jgi:hypothetical protein